jgi:protein-S-isoprenylcysteine O-methyltransferase Ste14
MNRIITLLYGTVSYAIFFGTFLYAVAFLGNLPLAPKTIDSGVETRWVEAVAINLLLLTLFALQHSVMARPGFKRWWTRFVSQPAERSTYVLASSVAMILLFWGWQPLPAEVFVIDHSFARGVVTALFLGGVGLVLYATFLIDHFDLFGLRQVVLHFRGKPYSEKRFVTPSLYRHVRHPLYVGWFITFWATPDMTVGHLLMAVVTTAYILVAVIFEERDLSAHLGDAYRQYRQQTPKFVPRLTSRSRSEEIRTTQRAS